MDLINRIKDLEVALHDKNTLLQITFRMTETSANLLRLFLGLELVTPELIDERLPDSTEIKVAVFRLRESLRPYGIRVQSKRKLGYWLEPEDKAKILDMVDNRRQATPPGDLHPLTA